MPFFYYFDPTYILVLIGLVISVWAQVSVQSTFNKYSRVRISRGITGADAARQVLSYGKVSDVSIKGIKGSMTERRMTPTRTDITTTTVGSMRLVRDSSSCSLSSSA